MKLNDYLEREGIKKYKFAEKCGISNRTISSVCSGYKVNELMGKIIEDATNGEVKVEDVCKQPRTVKEYSSED